MPAAAFALIFGTVGFVLELGQDWEDAFDRAVVTSTLTGLDSRHGNRPEPLTLMLVLAGVAIYALVASVLVEAITRGVVGGARADKRRRQTIERMRDNFIISRYGRVGRRVADELREAGVPYVAIDVGPEAVAHAEERGDLPATDTGTDDETLRAAGSERARGLAVSSDPDTDNLGITLSARGGRPSADRRAGVERRRRPPDPALRRGGTRAGEARAAAAGSRLPRRRLDRRAGFLFGERSRRATRAPARASATCGCASRPARSRSCCATARSTRHRRPTRSSTRATS
jgi:hypothetical protein